MQCHPQAKSEADWDQCAYVQTISSMACTSQWPLSGGRAVLQLFI